MKGTNGMHTAVATAGLLLAVTAGPFLYQAARGTENLLMEGGMGLFLATVMLYYGSPALQQVVRPESWRAHCSVINSAAGLLLIAGTYTPFCVGPLREAEGMMLLIPEWILATAGGSLKICGGMRYRKLTAGIQILMVCLGIAWARPLIAAISAEGMWWLLAGGIFYLGGTVCRLSGKGVMWQVLAVTGTGIHGWTIWRYVLHR